MDGNPKVNSKKGYFKAFFCWHPSTTSGEFGFPIFFWNATERELY